MVVNGSLSKTAVNGSAGAKSQVSGLVVAADDDRHAAAADRAVRVAARGDARRRRDRRGDRARRRRARCAGSTASGPRGSARVYGRAARADFIAAIAAMLGVLVFDTLPGPVHRHRRLAAAARLPRRRARTSPSWASCPSGPEQWNDLAAPPGERHRRRASSCCALEGGAVLRRRRPRPRRRPHARPPRGRPRGRARPRDGAVRRRHRRRDARDAARGARRAPACGCTSRATSGRCATSCARPATSSASTRRSARPSPRRRAEHGDGADRHPPTPGFRRRRGAEAADLDQLEPERVDEVDHPVQRRLVLHRPVQHGLDGLDRRAQALEPRKQRGRHPAPHSDLVLVHWVSNLRHAAWSPPRG